MEKLPVWSILNDSILYVKNEFSFFLRAALVPFILLVLFRFILLFWLSGQGYSLQMQGTILFYMNVVVEQLILIPLWVSVYRRIILGDEAGGFGYLSHLDNKIAYLKYEILFIVMMLVPMSIGSYANYHLIEAAQFSEKVQLTVSAQYLPYLGLATSLYIFVLVISMRFTLILPVMAIGASAGLMDSWRATRGHIWRLLAYVFFYILTVGMLNFFLRGLLNMPERSDISGSLSLDMFYSVMLFMISVPMGCILTTALAYAFIFLAQQDEQNI
ncbi:hypothetical protein [Curvivirga sp.]|uniref:hypothetical protein n=1 Tax=Curvivirga sp. TaxID=2856848 RepID=UPI003B58C8B7